MLPRSGEHFLNKKTRKKPPAAVLYMTGQKGAQVLNDEKIVRSIAQGDSGAIRRLMEDYTPLLWKITYGILGTAGSDQDAEECIADVFIRLWSRPQDFDAARSSLKTSLCVMTRSRALDRLRSLKRRSTEELTEWCAAAADLEEEMISAQRAEELHRAMQQLSPEEKKALELRYMDELKPPVIGEILGLSTRQTENLLYRSKEKLKKIMEKGNHE